MIQLRTLGTIELHRSDGSELGTVLAQPRRLALLAYLAVAVPRGWHRRDKLLSLFWPEADQDRARAALNRAIYFLRQELGEGILRSRGDDEVGLDFERFRCDTADFGAALDDGHHETAVELYRGDLLPGFFATDAPGFEAWLELERAHLRERAAAAAWALVKADEQRGDRTGAAQWARRAVELAPFDEVGFRRYLTLLDQSGDRAGAAQAYQQFVDQLAADLELAPSPETKALIDAIRRREGSPPDPVVLDPVGADPASISRSPPSPVAPPSPALPARLARSYLTRAAVLVMVLGGAAGGLAVRSRGRLDPRRVEVLPFENRTGQPEVDRWGTTLADQIRADLVRSSLVEAVAPNRSDTGIVRGADTEPPRPGRHRAGTVVSGAFYLEAGTTQVRAWITDARTNRVVWEVPPSGAPTSDPAPAVDEVRRRAVGAVAALLTPRFAAWFPIATSPPTIEAFRAFADGIELQLQGEPRRAIDHFRRAVALDTTFTWARMQQAVSHMNLAETKSADSIIDQMAALRDRLPPLQRHWLDWMRALQREDLIGAHRAIQAAADLAPHRFLYSLADDASYLNRPGEVVAALERLGADNPYNGGWIAYWYHLTYALHLLGQHQRELTEAGRGRARHPERVSSLSHQTTALAALGRVTEVAALLDTALTLPVEHGYSPGRLMMAAGEELRAHGHPEAALDAFRRAVAWLRSHPPADSTDVEHRLELGRASYLATDWATADDIFRSLASEAPSNHIYLGYLGTAAARRGDRAGAEGAIAAIERLRGSLARPNEEANWWQAKITSLLGDGPRALQLMATAVGPQGRGELHVDFDFEPLWNSPAFREFIRPKG